MLTKVFKHHVKYKPKITDLSLFLLLSPKQINLHFYFSFIIFICNVIVLKMNKKK